MVDSPEYSSGDSVTSAFKYLKDHWFSQRYFIFYVFFWFIFSPFPMMEGIAFLYSKPTQGGQRITLFHLHASQRLFSSLKTGRKHHSKTGLKKQPQFRALVGVSLLCDALFSFSYQLLVMWVTWLLPRSTAVKNWHGCLRCWGCFPSCVPAGETETACSSPPCAGLSILISIFFSGIIFINTISMILVLAE